MVVLRITYIHECFKTASSLQKRIHTCKTLLYTNTGVCTSCGFCILTQVNTETSHTLVALTQGYALQNSKIFFAVQRKTDDELKILKLHLRSVGGGGGGGGDTPREKG